MDIYKERIRPLFDSSGLQDKEIEALFDLPRGVIYKWGTGNYKSYQKYIPQIASYFHVSTDYLFGNTDDPRPADQKEKADPQEEIGLDETTKRLIAVAKDGTPEEIDKIIEYAAFLRSQRDKG